MAETLKKFYAEGHLPAYLKRYNPFPEKDFKESTMPDQEYPFTAETPPDESWWSALLRKAESSAVCDVPLDKQPDDQTNEGRSIDWEWAQELYQADEIVCLEVIGYNRGGLLVMGERIQGFVPRSHIVELSNNDSKNYLMEELAAYVGRTLALKVIECNPEQESIVFSERAALAAAGQRVELLRNLKRGDRVHGRVTTVTDFGVFVDLGGVEGLVHISELSWGRVSHPGDVLSLGDEVELYVLNLDQENCRVALSLKRLQPNPWETVHQRYQAGQVVGAVISCVVPYGAFAHLEDGIDGLIHVSEIQNCAKNPADVLAVGQRVEVVILQVDADRHRIGLRLHDMD